MKHSDAAHGRELLSVLSHPTVGAAVVGLTNSASVVI